MRSRRIVATAIRSVAGSLLSILLLGMIPGMALSAGQTNPSTSLEKTKSIAEAQHEIVVILIKQKEYDKAASEANKIFELKWPEDQEPLLVKEMRNLADQFLRAGQTSVGIRLIERNMRHFRRPSSQAALLKEMGYLHKNMNQNDKALDCFKKALDIEGGK